MPGHSMILYQGDTAMEFKFHEWLRIHCSDVIMSAMASQITGLSIVYSTAFSGANRRKHQSSASMAFVRGIPRWPMNSPHKVPVRRKMFPFDDVIMSWKRRCHCHCCIDRRETIFRTHSDRIISQPSEYLSSRNETHQHFLYRRRGDTGNFNFTPRIIHYNVTNCIWDIAVTHRDL